MCFSCFRQSWICVATGNSSCYRIGSGRRSGNKKGTLGACLKKKLRRELWLDWDGDGAVEVVIVATYIQFDEGLSGLLVHGQRKETFRKDVVSAIY